MKALLFLISFFPSYLFAPPVAMSKQDMISAWEFYFLTQPFTPERLKTALEIFVDKPAIAFAQSKLETGNFISDIWIENNNLFGMHQPKNRPTYSIAESRKCAVYRNWFESVQDYRLMQEWYYNRGYDHEYFMQVYCPHPEYLKRVNQMI
jgi:hypothetical protein